MSTTQNSSNGQFTPSATVRKTGISMKGEACSLVHMGLRKNKKRAHLLVSNILGKHIPMHPKMATLSGEILAGMVVSQQQNDSKLEKYVDEALDFLMVNASKRPDIIEENFNSHAPKLGEYIRSLRTTQTSSDYLVLGFAETATGLGANVANALGSEYVHSTRNFANRDIFLSFEEEHSHATSHAIVDIPEFSSLYNGSTPLILVDDEFSTGRTLINIIREVHAKAPRETYFIASLVDCRDGSHKVSMDKLARELNIRIHSLTLAAGEVELPENIMEFMLELEPLQATDGTEAKPQNISTILLRESPTNDEICNNKPTKGSSFIDECVEALSVLGLLKPDYSNTLVLGREEFMYYPQLLAEKLGGSFSSSTRSPIMIFNEKNYPVKNGICYTANDFSQRYAYNVRGFRNVVVIQDLYMTDGEMDRFADSLTAVSNKVYILKMTQVSETILKGKDV